MADPSTDAARCHLCGADSLQACEGYASLRRVTSDCRPWRAGGRLAVCAICGAVQTPVTQAWRDEASAIYAGYAIYRQSGGAEQLAFDPNSGQAIPRSRKLLEWVSAQGELAARGRLLDIGCGNGGLLRSFHEIYPSWSLMGTELDERNRPSVLAIPGVVGFHSGGLDEVRGRFDLVSMVHVLEHIPNPAEFLTRVGNRLASDGLLLVEVPDFQQNPFELLIADHCSHFTLDRLAALLEGAGYTVHAATASYVPKEISILAQVGTGAGGPRARRGTAGEVAEGVALALEWLRGMVARAREVSAGSRVGVFGTAIAGSWLFGEIEEAVAFFVDEDPHRVGKPYLARPVLHPRDVPPDSHVLIPLAPGIAAAIAERLSRPGVAYHLPPTGGSAGNRSGRAGKRGEREEARNFLLSLAQKGRSSWMRDPRMPIQ